MCTSTPSIPPIPSILPILTSSVMHPKILSAECFDRKFWKLSVDHGKVTSMSHCSNYFCSVASESIYNLFCVNYLETMKGVASCTSFPSSSPFCWPFFQALSPCSRTPTPRSQAPPQLYIISELNQYLSLCGKPWDQHLHIGKLWTLNTSNESELILSALDLWCVRQGMMPHGVTCQACLTSDKYILSCNCWLHCGTQSENTTLSIVYHHCQHQLRVPQRNWLGKGKINYCGQQ